MMGPHAYQEHDDGRHGCQVCPYSPHHAIHTGGDVGAAVKPAEDRSRLFYGATRLAAVHVGRRGSDAGQAHRTRRREDPE